MLVVWQCNLWASGNGKKPWNLFTSWLLCRSAIIILSLITSNAFCHLLVTNLHLADYQRSPNQWVIGVEDCVDNPGNESIEKLKMGEDSCPLQRWDLHPAFLYHSDTIPSRWEVSGGVRQILVTGNGMNHTSLCNNTSSKRLISDRLCQQVLPGEAQAEQAQTCLSLHFHCCLLEPSVNETQRMLWTHSSKGS